MCLESHDPCFIVGTLPKSKSDRKRTFVGDRYRCPELLDEVEGGEFLKRYKILKKIAIADDEEQQISAGESPAYRETRKSGVSIFRGKEPLSRTTFFSSSFLLLLLLTANDCLAGRSAGMAEMSEQRKMEQMMVECEMTKNHVIKQKIVRQQFEAGVRRWYFHVKPLDAAQLQNWRAYLARAVAEPTSDAPLKTRRASVSTMSIRFGIRFCRVWCTRVCRRLVLIKAL